MQRFWGALGVTILLGAIVGSSFFAIRFRRPASGTDEIFYHQEKPAKTAAELRAEALDRSAHIKGLYISADVASGAGSGPERLRNYLLGIATSSEINGFVIDVKEVCGPDYDEERIRRLLAILKENNIWAIARIVVFKDHSQIEVHPEWYLSRKSPLAVGNECWNKRHLRAKGNKTPVSSLDPPAHYFWRDKRGGYWLDPAHPEVQSYIIEFSKKIIDLGFDELQFDYIRFPSDGDVENAIYPAWNGKIPKYEVMKKFFERLSKELRAYKPDIILSVDLFGYAAIRAGDVGIGQRLEDIGENFDYISFMVYPSHYYNGLYLPADPERNLAALNYNFRQARAKPDEVVYRSLLFARDFLDGRLATSTIGSVMPEAATSTVQSQETPKIRSRVRLRPWLEDFFHEEDKAAGRPYGKDKVKLQIEAAEKVENHGWLLWNASNIYTTEALRKE